MNLDILNIVGKSLFEAKAYLPKEYDSIVIAMEDGKWFTRTLDANRRRVHVIVNHGIIFGVVGTG